MSVDETDQKIHRVVVALFFWFQNHFSWDMVWNNIGLLMSLYYKPVASLGTSSVTPQVCNAAVQSLLTLRPEQLEAECHQIEHFFWLR